MFKVDGLVLPKKYLSYSACDCFNKYPDQFRKRYYLNERTLPSPEMTFGKKIAEMYENQHPSLKDVKQYNVFEQPLKTEIAKIPFYGFIDSFDPCKLAFIELKTGKQPWTAKRVENHKQLDLYSLAILTTHGDVQDECELIWLQTERQEKETNGLITHGGAYGIALTGVTKTFVRHITPGDRTAAAEYLRQTAERISEDYNEWLLASRTSGLR